MTQTNSTENIKENAPARSWWEQHGPIIYGIGVFVGLALIGAIHSLLGA
jgi:hypothetical protein